MHHRAKDLGHNFIHGRCVRCFSSDRSVPCGLTTRVALKADLEKREREIEADLEKREREIT
jgi:hypothetical protein